MEVAAIYTDGGCIGPNPSRLGGTWAYCFVDGLGRRIGQKSGWVTAAESGLEAVSNNFSELFAVVAALADAPEGWDGSLLTDSRITLLRVSKASLPRPKFKGVPEWLIVCLDAAKARTGRYCTRLLRGHPSRRELLLGRTRKGGPCSPHNVHCDRLCNEEAMKFRRSTAPHRILPASVSVFA